MSTPSIYIPEIRRKWARVDATTLSAAAPRLGMTALAAKSRRDRYPQTFPTPLPIEYVYLPGVAIYSFHELSLMFNSDNDIRTVPTLAARLREEMTDILAFVEPVTLGVIAKRHELTLTVVRSTWRGGRDAKRGSLGNGFPFALQLSAIHTMTTMLYSWLEVEAWLNWSMGDGQMSYGIGATNDPPLHEFMEELERDDDLKAHKVRG